MFTISPHFLPSQEGEKSKPQTSNWEGKELLGQLSLFLGISRKHWFISRPI